MDYHRMKAGIVCTSVMFEMKNCTEFRPAAKFGSYFFRLHRMLHLGLMVKTGGKKPHDSIKDLLIFDNKPLGGDADC